MTEQEYIRATNRVKVSLALTILADILTSDDEEYGVSKDQLQEITSRLSEAQDKLFASYEISEQTLRQ